MEEEDCEATLACQPAAAQEDLVEGDVEEAGAVEAAGVGPIVGNKA